jgi:hypothetical protein
VIEAIERAVWHERYIADPKSEPFLPFGFRSAPRRGRRAIAQAVALQ